MLSKQGYVLGPVFSFEKQKSLKPIIRAEFEHDCLGVSLYYLLDVLEIILSQKPLLSCNQSMQTLIIRNLFRLKVILLRLQ